MWSVLPNSCVSGLSERVEKVIEEEDTKYETAKTHKVNKARVLVTLAAALSAGCNTPTECKPKGSEKTKERRRKRRKERRK